MGGPFLLSFWLQLEGALKNTYGYRIHTHSTYDTFSTYFWCCTNMLVGVIIFTGHPFLHHLVVPIDGAIC